MSKEISQAPKDGISCLKFSPNDPMLLLCSSWDKSVTLYQDTDTIYSYQHKAPVLDCCFSSDSTKIYSVGLDRTLKAVSIETQTENLLGTHEDGISCVATDSSQELIVTGSWDSSVKLWDQRIENPLINNLEQQGKVFSLDIFENMLVVALSGRQIQIYDLRNTRETYQSKESSLKYMTRKVACMTDGKGYATSSIEGRVAIDFFDQSAESQALKFSFKCHRQKVNFFNYRWKK